jgi:hypothetical protein
MLFGTATMQTTPPESQNTIHFFSRPFPHLTERKNTFFFQKKKKKKKKKVAMVPQRKNYLNYTLFGTATIQTTPPESEKHKHILSSRLPHLVERKRLRLVPPRIVRRRDPRQGPRVRVRPRGPEVAEPLEGLLGGAEGSVALWGGWQWQWGWKYGRIDVTLGGSGKN